MSRSVFLSYCRADGQRVQRLAEDVRALGYSPWLDQEIGGGQAWWNEILRQIRGADIVVVALSAAALESVACLREFEYATALGKPILPICVNADFAPALLPAALAALQIVTWKPDDASAALHLSRALMNMPAAPPAPTVEPTPPPAPLSYLASLHERVTAAQELGLKEQSALLIELKQRARAGKDRDELRALMQILRARFDLFASVAEELDQVLRDQEHGHPVGEARPALDESALARTASSEEKPPPGPSSPATASATGPEGTSSTTHASLSPVEAPLSKLTTSRKRNRLTVLTAGAACCLLAGIGVLTYVYQGPTPAKPTTTDASVPVAAVTSERTRDENLPAFSADLKPSETTTAGAPSEESMQPRASTPDTAPAAAAPMKRKPRRLPDAEPMQRSLFAQVADKLRTWKVTAKKDCEPDSVHPRGCTVAEKVTASLHANATVTWGACSCRLNAAARKSIEEMANWIL